MNEQQNKKTKKRNRNHKALISNMENLHLEEPQDFKGKNFYVSKNWVQKFTDEIANLAGGEVRTSGQYL